ncbi:hypothetical protein N836_22745 [Leptolyngbya sp. Heron Island J]|uniref:hypothetical protein n=1 Tax=Leptolyngbya sp. Heron Island J TaxID=1385935 RepID=UPI0003B994A0|nr:hypothetical protein [Leptolyngbya sp. Heron Island J]ESA33213.1 hypothetical protein N836_22745 [Leptolyngbya sp. Heron Island J]
MENPQSKTSDLQSVSTDSIIAYTESQSDKGASQNIDFCNTFTVAAEPFQSFA